MRPQGDPDRYEPMPSLLELPAWLLRKLPPRLRVVVVALFVTGGISIAVVTIVVILPAARNRQAAQRESERRQLEQRLADVRLRQRPHRLTVPRAGLRSPAAEVAALEDAIARFAGTSEAPCRARVNGPPHSFACDAIRSRSTTTRVTTPFIARLDPATGVAAFCRSIAPPGVPTEHELRSYRISRACGGP